MLAAGSKEPESAAADWEDRLYQPCFTSHSQALSIQQTWRQQLRGSNTLDGGALFYLYFPAESSVGLMTLLHLLGSYRCWLFCSVCGVILHD